MMAVCFYNGRQKVDRLCLLQLQGTFNIELQHQRTTVVLCWSNAPQPVFVSCNVVLKNVISDSITVTCLHATLITHCRQLYMFDLLVVWWSSSQRCPLCLHSLSLSVCVLQYAKGYLSPCRKKIKKKVSHHHVTFCNKALKYTVILLVSIFKMPFKKIIK